MIYVVPLPLTLCSNDTVVVDIIPILEGTKRGDDSDRSDKEHHLHL